MSKLNATARATLKDYGVSQAGWARRNYYSDGKWHGDACGCPDDRCIGYHHDGPEDCGCLPVLLEQMAAEHASAGRELCVRCGEPVARPGESRPDGQPGDRARFCDGCIGRCHEATDFAHVCQICASPGEAARYGWEVRSDD